MSVLRASPLSLPYAAVVVAKLQARNAIGWSGWSTPNGGGARVQTEPVAASTPTPARGARTDHTRVEIEWQAMTLDTPAQAAAAGGAPITSYNLQWNQGNLDADGVGQSNDFVDLVGQPGSEYTSTSYLLVAGVTAGKTYKFRLRAWNKWGGGGPSNAVEIQASTIPGQVSVPITAITGSQVQISWTKPSEYGSPVHAYTILVQAAPAGAATEGVFTSAAPGHCNGADPSIVAAASCSIPLAVLRASPFNLPFDAPIIAIVGAHNANGPPYDPQAYAGLASAPSAIGARIQTAPVRMAAPTRGALTSESQLHIQWTELTTHAETGGAEVTSYYLEWDKGSYDAVAGTRSWYDLVGATSNYMQTEFTVTTDVVAGGEYAVRVSAVNAHGAGSPSGPSITEIVANARPGQMVAPTTAVAANAVDVRISWAPADAHSGTLDAYRLFIWPHGGSAPADVEVIKDDNGVEVCLGSSAGGPTALSCDIPFDKLRLAPFNLVQGDAVLAQVQAHNEVDWGPISETTEAAGAAIFQAKPH
jgi:hypothetical protein